jgi:P-type Ca2+ transporter type 2C
VSTKRTEHGYNELEQEEEDPLWRKYLDQFNDPLIGLLLASAIVSILVGQYDDAISITLAVAIVSTVAFVQELRSEQSIAALKELIPPSCSCIRDGTVTKIEGNY